MSRESEGANSLLEKKGKERQSPQPTVNKKHSTVGTIHNADAEVTQAGGGRGGQPPPPSISILRCVWHQVWCK